ncbi:chaperone protein dnaJ GFA2, mitochondrial-like [Quercus suber]|uniref:chaperone protein dnaJ GFA2, mitochondrial-like n=1 Tax=Quercus suber TaxID=58331 RepID=UPI0032DF0914
MQQGPFMVQITCPQCHGEREIVPPKYIYKSCKGRQVVLETKSVKLNIVPGVDNDETIKVSRSGGADPDGNQPGDLYIVIKVREDPVFRREGADINVDAVLSITSINMNSKKSPVMLFLNTSSVSLLAIEEEGFRDCRLIMVSKRWNIKLKIDVLKDTFRNFLAILGRTIQVPTLTGDVVLKFIWTLLMQLM